MDEAGPDERDAALCERVAAGDRAALAALYDRYARAVYALAAHALGAQEAEETVQEVFLRLWTRAGQFDPARASFAGWLLAIARHQVMDELRRRGQRARYLAAAEVERVLAAAPDPRPGPAEAAVRRERGTALLAALRDLPEAQRRALVLAYFGGLSQAEMARLLGWPLGTVKKRVRLGLHKLRAALAPFAPAGLASPEAPRAEVEHDAAGV